MPYKIDRNCAISKTHVEFVTRASQVSSIGILIENLDQNDPNKACIARLHQKYYKFCPLALARPGCKQHVDFGYMPPDLYATHYAFNYNLNVVESI